LGARKKESSREERGLQHSKASKGEVRKLRKFREESGKGIRSKNFNKYSPKKKRRKAKSPWWGRSLLKKDTGGKGVRGGVGWLLSNSK